MGRKLCTVCERIYTNQTEKGKPVCLNCTGKFYPSKISSVYPEGSLHQKLATHAFNYLGMHLEDTPGEAAKLAQEFGVSEDAIFRTIEELYTEN
ncbi:hypothetical protein D3C75_689710 [compost metagenome]